MSDTTNTTPTATPVNELTKTVQAYAQTRDDFKPVLDLHFQSLAKIIRDAGAVTPMGAKRVVSRWVRKQTQPAASEAA